MTIQNAHAYLEGVWDWAMLNGCFGETNIKPTDIDGFVERNGNFLVLETKKVGVEIPPGQLITFNQLRKTNVFTIVVLWGDNKEPEYMQVFTKSKVTEIKQCNIEVFRKVVKWWFDKANKK